MATKAQNNARAGVDSGLSREDDWMKLSFWQLYLPINSLPAEGRLTLVLFLAGTIATVTAWLAVGLLGYSAFTTKPHLSVQHGKHEVTLFWSVTSTGDESCWEIRKNDEILPIRTNQGGDAADRTCPLIGMVEQEHATCLTTDGVGAASTDQWGLKERCYTVAELTNDRTYAFSVRARHESGEYGPWSNIVNASPSAITHLLSSVDRHVSQYLPDIASSTDDIANSTADIAKNTTGSVGQHVTQAHISNTTNITSTRLPNYKTAKGTQDAPEDTSLLARRLSAIASSTAAIASSTAAIASNTAAVIEPNKEVAHRDLSPSSINVNVDYVNNIDETTVVYGDDEPATQTKGNPDDWIDFGTLYFDHDRRQICRCDENEIQLTAIVNALAEHPGRVCVEGRATGVGRATYNLDLAEARAEIVADFLRCCIGGADMFSHLTIGEGHDLPEISSSDGVNRRVVVYSCPTRSGVLQRRLRDVGEPGSCSCEGDEANTSSWGSALGCPTDKKCLDRLFGDVEEER